MRRNADNAIHAKPLSRFEVMRHDVSIDKEKFEDIWNCVYEHVEVYTDAGRALIAYKFCGHGYVNCFDKRQETPTSKVMLLDNDKHFQEVIKWNWKQYNAYQNCLGFCVLDGHYWINLSEENVNVIISDDSYIEVSSNCTEDHLLLYYHNGSPVHVSRFSAVQNSYEHKIGCNAHIPRPTSDISDIYKYDVIKYYKKNITL